MDADPTRHDMSPCLHEVQLAAAREKIADLETALRTSRRIGTAVGIVMATLKLTYDEAFDILVVASQASHRKIRDLAEQVVLTGEPILGPQPAGDPNGAPSTAQVSMPLTMPHRPSRGAGTWPPPKRAH